MTTKEIPPKKNILFLVGCEPQLAYRIRIEAESLAKNNTVVLRGIRFFDESLSYEKQDGYEEHRTVPPLFLKGLFTFMMNFVRAALHYHCYGSLAIFLMLVTGGFILLLPIFGLILGCFIIKMSILAIKSIGKNIRSWWYNTSFMRLVGLLRTISRRSFAHFNDWYALQSSPDVIYLKDLDVLPAAVAIQLFTRSSIVYGCYEFYPHSIPNFPRWAVKILIGLERLLISKVSRIITVTPPMAQAIQKTYPIVNHPVIWVPNVDPVLSLPPFKKDPVLKKTIKGRRSFLYQGSFANERGIEELLQAWKYIDPTQGVLIIRGPHNIFREKYIEMAKALGIFDTSVVFLSPLVDRKECIVQSIQAALEVDVCLIPYLPVTLNNKNACPRKLSHFMHAGRMILCNDLDYVKSIVLEAKCGIVYDHKNIDTLVDAINLCIQDKNLVKRYQKNALTYARNHYNWEHYELKFLDSFLDETASN